MSAEACKTCPALLGETQKLNGMSDAQKEQLHLAKKFEVFRPLAAQYAELQAGLIEAKMQEQTVAFLALQGLCNGQDCVFIERTN